MMGIKRLSWLVGTAVVATLGMQITVQAQGHAVVDISEWQGQLSPSQVQAMKSQVLFVINRRQYGLNYVDRDAANNTALYVRYGIPFVSMIFRNLRMPLARAVKPKRFMRTPIKLRVFMLWILKLIRYVQDQLMRQLRLGIVKCAH